MEHNWLVHCFGLDVHWNTLIMVWVSIGVLLLGAAALTSKLSVRPGAGQSVAEGIYDFCRSITFSTAGERGDSFLFYIGSLFLFIITCNLLGQLPLRLITLPHGELLAATGDINVPAALALCTLVMYFAVGIKAKGLGYFKHYLSPLPMLVKNKPLPVQVLSVACFWPFLFLNLSEDVIRPGSLMLRLFFNILVGEILVMVVSSIVPGGLGLGVFVIFLELFVAVVQAYIFAILSSVYIALMSEDHDDHHDEAHTHEPQDASALNPVLKAA
jgi:F-type H+-transporting ATPase subunit a